MANWSGTYTITAGTTGTATAGSATTLTNSGATWPTGAQSLANFTVRILSGTGAGQTRVITSNTATVLTVPTWGTNPDATSVYEIVLIFANNDHITAALTLSTNIITELADSATILFDGSYILTLSGNVTIRWAKAEGTLCTFDSNSRTTQGKRGFWQYLNLSNLSNAPAMSYLRIRDATYCLVISFSTAAGDLTGVKRLWFENTTNAFSLGVSSSAAVTTLQEFFFKNTSARLAVAAENNNVFTWQKSWQENCDGGGISKLSNATTTLQYRDIVSYNSWSNSQGNTAAAQTMRVYDNYVGLSQNVTGPGGLIFLGSQSAADAGTHYMSRNVFIGSRIIYNASACTANYYSQFNDCASTQNSSFRYNDSGAGAFTAFTSDNDYIAGTNGAISENIDTTASTTSTSSPQQYQNLTATRTNPKSVRNKPLTADNVVATPTADTCAVTFDCQNGAVAGQGSTTINVDSNSGQATINVASVTGFEVGEIVELGYGTARAETVRLSAVGASTLTAETNLTFSHTAAQADTVKKQLRHWGLAFIRYGLTSGIYTDQTDVPNQEDWGLIYTSIKKTFNGVAYDWKKTGHSDTITGLEPGTTYYATAYFYTPLGEVGASTEFTFTTSSSALYTDPGVANVRLGTTYQFNSASPNRTGTVRVPTAAQVQIGVVFDASDTVTGTYNGSDRWTDPGDNNVRVGVTYKANSTTSNKTGRVTVPTAAQVKVGVAFEVDLGTTGTYDGSDRWTDPGDTNVRVAIAYKANSLTNNKTGRVTVPTAGQVKIGTLFEIDLGTTGTYDGSERYTDVPQANVIDGYDYRYNSLVDNREGTFTTPTTADIALAVWGTDISGYVDPTVAGFVLYRVYRKLRNLISIVVGLGRFF